MDPHPQSVLVTVYFLRRPSSRSSSMSRDRPGSGRGRSSSTDGSRKRSASAERSQSSVSSAGRVSVKGDDVKIEVRSVLF